MTFSKIFTHSPIYSSKTFYATMSLRFGYFKLLFSIYVNGDMSATPVLNVGKYPHLLLLWIFSSLLVCLKWVSVLKLLARNLLSLWQTRVYTFLQIYRVIQACINVIPIRNIYVVCIYTYMSFYPVSCGNRDNWNPFCVIL